MQRSQRQRGIHPVALISLYVLVALLPLGFAIAQGLAPRPFMDELSSALAMVGFSMLLMEFVISGRFRTVSGRIGIDLSMRFHQLIARTLAVFLLVHPWLYTLPTGGGRPGDASSATALNLAGWPAATGWIAWFALLVLVVWAMFRGSFGYRYEVWRVSHGLGAVVVALLGLNHALGVGRYSADAALASLWYVMVGIALLAMLHVYLIRPLLKRRHPYRVVSVESVALNSWELTLEPEHADALAFEPGQFVWLSVDRSAFSITEHPFSMSSCPGDRPHIAFTIKEVGDFTSTIATIPHGAVAYLDGPHGNLVTTGRAATGLVLIAGGVGLAPIMSILRQARIDGETRPVRLVYGNRVEAQIMYRRELEELTEALDLDVIHVLGEPPPGWTGRVGQLDSELLETCLSMPDRRQWLYVLCGPSPMVDGVERSLMDLGVPLHQIVSEKFSYD